MRSLQYSKIMLSNPNLYYTIASEMWKNNSELGNIRESLFVSQINLSINASKVVDYTISLESRKIEFEIGGKNKTRKQIQEIDNGYVFRDDIEIGYENIISLFLIGFLY